MGPAHASPTPSSAGTTASRLPRLLAEMAEELTPQEEWAAFLGGTHPHLQDKSPLRFIPSSPRCRLCSAPFGRPGAFVFRRYGYTPWEKNPTICGRCFKGIEAVAKMCPTAEEDGEINGAEVELSMLFADVRGSSKLARQMPTWDFTRLMNRFYNMSKEVLVEADAIIEKFVGDEVVALFVPLMTGPDHARTSRRGGRGAAARDGSRRSRALGAARRGRAHRGRVRRRRRDEGVERLHRARRPGQHRRAPRVAGGGRRDPGDRRDRSSGQR